MSLRNKDLDDADLLRFVQAVTVAPPPPTMAEFANSWVRTKPITWIKQPDGSCLYRREDDEEKCPFLQAQRWGWESDQWRIVDWVFEDGSRVREMDIEFKKYWTGEVNFVWEFVKASMSR